MRPGKPRVLIVEDEDSFSDMLGAFFDRWGWLHAAVPLANDAIARLDEGWDLIVLDLMLPQVSGDAVLREVRRRGLPVPVAVVTSKTQWEAERDVEGLSPDRLILKLHFDEIKAYAAELLEKYHAAP